MITQFASGRWSIEVLFRASKQVLALEALQHWSRRECGKVGSVGVVDAECGGYLVSHRRVRVGIAARVAWGWDGGSGIVNGHYVRSGSRRRQDPTAVDDPNSANEAEPESRKLKTGQPRGLSGQQS